MIYVLFYLQLNALNIAFLNTHCSFKIRKNILLNKI